MKEKIQHYPTLGQEFVHHLRHSLYNPISQIFFSISFLHSTKQNSTASVKKSRGSPKALTDDTLIDKNRHA